MLTNYGAGPNAPDRPLRHLLLFLATVATTTWMGVGLIGRGAAYEAGGWPVMLGDGLLYALPFLLFLTTHEFGHYLMARARGVSVSLPYFIPVPLALGTLGAVIRIREPLRRTRTLFDIGAAGPLAGFVIALALVLVGLATIPEPSYLLTVSTEFHEPLIADFARMGRWPTLDEVLQPGLVVMLFGDTVLWHLLMQLSPYAPPAYELQHYPLLLAGWLGLFFTALNLLPVGQLDGGHVVYALFGPRVHSVVARITTSLLIVSGALGASRDFPMLTGPLAGWVAGLLNVPEGSIFQVYEAGEWAAWPLLAYLLFLMLRRFFGGRTLLALGVAAALTGAVGLTLAFAPGVVSAVGYTGWLAWSALILFLIKVDHPPVLVTESLDVPRRVAGYACLVLFVLCFSVRPLEQQIGEGPVPAERPPPIRVETGATPGGAAPGEGTPARIAAPEGGR